MATCKMPVKLKLVQYKHNAVSARAFGACSLCNDRAFGALCTILLRR